MTAFVILFSPLCPGATSGFLGADRGTHIHGVTEALLSWSQLRFFNFALLCLSSGLPPRALLLLTWMIWSPAPTTAPETPPVTFLLLNSFKTLKVLFSL